MDFEVWWVLAFTVVMTVLVGVYNLALAIINRNSSRNLPSELDERLRRIEYATESTAIEVERISESQRFLTRALNERLTDNVKSPPRVITPH